MSLNLAHSFVTASIWYPTILGVLVVIAAIVLFIGSIYLLLGTNLGARLGFLVTFTSRMGFLMILSVLWLTTASPLESPKGRVASWSVIENVPDITKAQTEAVRDIAKKENKASQTDASNVLAAVDAALVTKQSTPTVTVTPNDNRFAKFDDVTQFMVLQTYTLGGSNPQFWKGQFNHSTKYAVVEYCKTATQTQTFGLPPLPPECASGADAQRGFVVVKYDYGTLRLPPFVVIVITAILFGLGLLALHWREKDEMERAKAEAGPVAVPARDDSELTKV
ncbi:MAG TPA: hypothetical protein VIA11_22955 [Acidimicrobiia bacterium]|nr:hypothetical protein [Acidimicrobiia bacterium]